MATTPGLFLVNVIASTKLGTILFHDSPIRLGIVCFYYSQSPCEFTATVIVVKVNENMVCCAHEVAKRNEKPILSPGSFTCIKATRPPYDVKRKPTATY